MEINIKANAEEKEQVLTAIVELTKVKHIRYHSHTMLANHTGIKATKIRAVLIDLLNEGKIEAYKVNETRVARYFYRIIQ